MRVQGKYGSEDADTARDKLLHKDNMRWKGPVRGWIPRRQWSLSHWRLYQSGNGKVQVSLFGEVFTWCVTLGKFSVFWDCDEDDGR